MRPSRKRPQRPDRKRTLRLESLENRLPFALEVLMDPPVVSSFFSGAQILGLEASVVPQTPTSYVFDSAARRQAIREINGTLYSFDGGQVFATNVLNGNTQSFSVTPLAGTVGAEVHDVALIDDQLRFVGGSITGNPAAGKRTIPTMWNPAGTPTRIGPANTNGLAKSILADGLVVGFFEDAGGEIVPWLHSNTVDIKLPSVDLPGVAEQVLRGSDSSTLLIGTAGTEFLGWQVSGSAEDGEFELVFSPDRPLDYPQDAVSDEDGASYRVVEGSGGDTILLGHYYLPALGGTIKEYHTGLWSLSGAQLFDFGANKKLFGAQVLGETIVVAHESSLSFLTDQSVNEFQLNNLLGQPAVGTSRRILDGGLLLAGTELDPKLVVSYAEVGATTVHKVALINAKVPTMLEVDAENDGVFENQFFGSDMPFPTFVPGQYGPLTLAVKATYNDGTFQTATKTYESLPFAAVDFFSGRELLLGGTATSDSMELEGRGVGLVRASTAGRAQNFDGIDTISVNLGQGNDRLKLSGGVTIDLGFSSNVEIVDAANNTSETIQQIDDFNVFQQVGSNGTLTLVLDQNDSIELLGTWVVHKPELVSGQVTARLTAAEVTLLVQAGSYRNPLNAVDVSFDSFVSARDALLIINHLNSSTGTAVPNIDAYLDVNGNGTISALDVLLVINFINNRPGGEGEIAVDANRSQVTDTDWLENRRKRLSFG